MNHAKRSFSTEICAGAIISVVQYLAPLRYSIECLLLHWRRSGKCIVIQAYLLSYRLFICHMFINYFH
jgi:hypothetical protein